MQITLSSSYLSPVKTILIMSQEKWFIFIILLFIVPASLSCLLPFVPVETWPDGYLVGKELVILLFECAVGKVFCCILYFLSHLLSMLGL